MKKQYIIPIFVPHLGCPNNCTFCNQKIISGQQKQITEKELIDTIEYYLKNFKEKEIEKEIAFFGGSFTGIEKSTQESLLKIAYSYKKAGIIQGIRISTRPDYIDKDKLKLLKHYGVTTIELGVQSTNDYILKKCKRGHTFKDVKNASKLIRKYRFILGHQMMVGLPESTRKDEITTAKDLAKLKPKIVRIYPVLVIKGTELEEELNKGEYEPLKLAQAVETCKDLSLFFKKQKINVIRIGLQNTDVIINPEKEKSEVVAGPYHECFRQLVESAIWYEHIVEKIKSFNVRVKEIEIKINPQDANYVVGYKRENIENLKKMYNVIAKIVQDTKMRKGKFEVTILKKYTDFLDE